MKGKLVPESWGQTLEGLKSGDYDPGMRNRKEMLPPPKAQRMQSIVVRNNNKTIIRELVTRSLQTEIIVARTWLWFK